MILFKRVKLLLRSHHDDRSILLAEVFVSGCFDLICGDCFDFFTGLAVVDWAESDDGIDDAEFGH